MRAEFGLNETAGGRENLIGRDGGADQQINLRRINARTLDGLLRGTHGELRSVLAVRGLVSLLDAGARSDPLVRRFDHLFEVGIRQDAFGIRASGAQNAGACVHHLQSPSFTKSAKNSDK
jgi:hypothetical protein